MTCPADHNVLKLKTGTIWCRTCHPLGPPLRELVFNPDHEAHGSFAPKGRGHTHVMHICAWTPTGPLRVLMGCLYCSKSASVWPNKRLRKVPEGFTAESWAKFLVKGDERLAQVAV